LPLSWAQAIGRALGHAAYLALPGYRRLAQEHLGFAFGDRMAAAERRRIARGVFANLGQSAMEWLALPGISATMLQQMITCEGLEHLQAALKQGNGVVMVSAHFGNWELVPLYVKSLGFEGGVLARRLRYPEYESFLISMRGEKGVPTFARGSLKDIATLLRSNQVIGIMPDQDMDSLDGVFVDFFGHPTYTPVGPAALAMLTRAPILPCFLIREGARFRFVIEPPVKVGETRNRMETLAQLTQGWSAVVESYIRRYPDHWVWMHRRWKTKPMASAPAPEAPPGSQAAAANTCSDTDRGAGLRTGCSGLLKAPWGSRL
jgi:KDO2-lipid IV(A) lauroyltransferase